MSKKQGHDVAKLGKGAGRDNMPAGSMDRIKVIAALLVLTTGVIGYYHFAPTNRLLAFGLLFAGFAISLGAFFLSKAGRDLVIFFKEARVELRKVVWPSMDETKKMTIIVLIVMSVVLIYLLLADSVLSGLLKYILTKV